MKDGAKHAKEAPFKDNTGELRGSIESGIEGKLADGQVEGFVRATAKHAGFVEYDTKPHDIVPKKRRQKGQAGAKTRRGQRALHFQVGGEDVFRKRVHHPGTEGMHFIENCITEQEVGTRVENALARKLDVRRPNDG